MANEEKTSEFLERYTKEHPETGQKYIDAVGALNEMYSRLKGDAGAKQEIYTALSDAGGAIADLDKRIRILEGKKSIEVISPDMNIEGLLKSGKY